MFYPDLLSQFDQFLATTQPVYLVGGAIRDALLGRPCVDFDFVTTEDPRSIGRKVADELGGNFFLLDKQRHTCRVLADQRGKPGRIYDFSARQGDSIEMDLSQRDFTINAMAINLHDPDRIIDPFNGRGDLAHKLLKPVSPEALISDPLRTLRAIRYAVNLDLRMDREALTQLQDAVYQLGQVSMERKRDELFKILDGKRVTSALKLLEQFKIRENFPLAEFETNGANLDRVRSLEALIQWSCGEKKASAEQNFFEASFRSYFERHKDSLREYFSQKNAAGRSRKAILLLAMWLQGSPWERDSGKGQFLSLSTDEINFLERFTDYYLLPVEFFQQSLNPEPIQIYDYFQISLDAGVDLLFAFLAEQYAKPAAENNQREWLARLEFVSQYLSAWFNTPELIDPKPLLDGNEIMANLQLAAGPEVGMYLEALKREQVKGKITTKKEAIAWLDLVPTIASTNPKRKLD